MSPSFAQGWVDLSTDEIGDLIDPLDEAVDDCDGGVFQAFNDKVKSMRPGQTMQTISQRDLVTARYEFFRESAIEKGATTESEIQSEANHLSLYLPDPSTNLEDYRRMVFDSC